MIILSVFILILFSQGFHQFLSYLPIFFIKLTLHIFDEGLWLIGGVD